MSSGGVRPGAGRKAAGAPRVTITVRVLPETKAILARMKEQGIGIGSEIDKLAKE